MIPHPTKHLDANGKCCGARPMAYSKVKGSTCFVCCAEFNTAGRQQPNWAWREVEGGFVSNRAPA